jgi:hypothetical protein
MLGMFADYDIKQWHQYTIASWVVWWQGDTDLANS